MPKLFKNLINHFKLIITLLVIAGLLIWLYEGKKQKSTVTIKIKENLYGLKNRIYHSLKKIDSVQIESTCGDLFYLNDTLLLTPYDIESNEFQYYKLSNSKLIKHKICDEITSCIDIKTANSSFLYLLRIGDKTLFEKSKCCVYTSNEKKEPSRHKIDVPWVYTSQIDDSCFYVITKVHALTNLYRYNFYAQKIVDTLNLNELFKDTCQQLDLILEGKITIKDKYIIYKSVYSSIGLKLNKYNLKEYKTFTSIDSLPLPKFEAVELAPGFIQFHLTPEIYANCKIKTYKNYFVILSSLDYDFITKKSKVKNYMLDFYDKEMKYLFSYKLPPLNTEFFPYAMDFDPNNEIAFILYNDHKTILKFALND